MDKVSLLKEIHGCSSEELFDIIKQPEQQCPNVDRAIREFKDIIQECEYQKRACKNSHDVSQLTESISDIEWKVTTSDTVEELEKLRYACSLIRDWGNEWKSLAISLLNQREDIESLMSNKYQEED